ncbi:uncharacterized protein L969DRAFT_292246 [Mixia osmundae IAM 14324]|uniref:NADPH:adrenodoxin oxidoreductase, mitochondrial n=1 Tax=Mixia osmundae (strain CBS 9802 / IAM 14324 / JCM 22182 / KY 12970) TaxID=764103 RepID=G7DXJ9_MIXOS|nr:uncharacterized protein L969DRAFT_292246 [Mixia osmundae IAM 14324]KEI41196.1 hypothetical protein L969DRAFT_292246 [Mixia osmundae IAM 14324]GAA95309.1 hypothetical protein E5Q_01966 [Mixia osmundae IAM 14324]
MIRRQAQQLAQDAARSSKRRLASQASPLSLAGLPLRLAIVGSGPAGFYAAGRLLSLPGTQNVRIDLFEELPVPFGLVRFGVAPDHPEVKNCQHKFEETATDPRFRFFGNVQIGGLVDPDHAYVSPTPAARESRQSIALPLDRLQEHYDAVLLTYGASRDRELGLAGEDSLQGVLSARSFVHWYNAHPSQPDPTQLDLANTEHVTIIGQGNVALDCARILLSPIDSLRKTDLPEYVLAQLARSKVRHVDVVGRRGPLQIACTTKELRELLALPDVAFRTDLNLLAEAQSQLAGSPEMSGARMKKRLLDLMRKGTSDGSKSWSLSFLKSPEKLIPSETQFDRLSAVRYRHNALELRQGGGGRGGDPSEAKAVPTDSTSIQSTDLLLKSVGYRSIGIPGVPFDEQRGTVRNVDNRVISSNGVKVPGLYTCGWLARGPNGVIATTMYGAFGTAEWIVRDALDRHFEIRDRVPLDPASLSFGPQRKVIDWGSWQKIDHEERRRGARLDKPREKILEVSEMLDIASG